MANKKISELPERTESFDSFMIPGVAPGGPTEKADIMKMVKSATAGAVGSTDDLKTEDKSNAVAAINEVHDETKENTEQLTELAQEVENAAECMTPVEEVSDLDITDEEGNVIARFNNGGFQTKNFDSNNINTSDSINESFLGDDLPSKSIFLYGNANKFVRIPGLAVTNNGILLATCETRTSASDYGNNDLLFSKSTDNGKTWSTPYKLFPYENEKIASCLSFLVNRKTNRAFLFVNRYANSPMWENTHTMGVLSWDLVYKYSDDDGDTWSDELSAKSNIEDHGRFDEDIVCLMPGIGHGITMLDGTLVLNIQCKMNTSNTSSSGTKFNIQSGILYSKDNGVSWTLSKTLIPCYTSENEVIEYAPGKLAINCRSYIGKRRIFLSSDFGTTWTASTFDQKLIEPTACQGSFLKIRIGYRDSRVLFFNPRNSSSRSNLTVYSGKDVDSLVPQVQVSATSIGGYTDLGYFGKSIYCLFEKGTNTTDGTIEFCDLSNFLIL